jgi:hypothetical protein
MEDNNKMIPSKKVSDQEAMTQMRWKIEDMRRRLHRALPSVASRSPMIPSENSTLTAANREGQDIPTWLVEEMLRGIALP